jgi:hypothetical protein
MQPQLQEGPCQPWDLSTILRQLPNPVISAGMGMEVDGMNSAAPIKSMHFLAAEDQQTGDAKIANCCHSCRKVPGSRGTCLRFNGSPNAIICAGIIYGANSAASINAMIFQGAVHQLKGHSKFASSCPSWRRIPAAGPFVYDITAAHKCRYLCRDNVW